MHAAIAQLKTATHRGGHDDLWPCSQRGRLRLQAQTPHHKRQAHVCVLSQALDHAVHLQQPLSISVHQHLQCHSSHCSPVQQSTIKLKRCSCT